MDEVIADFAAKHLTRYNEHFNDALTKDDLQNQRLWHLRPQHVEIISGFLDEPGFFRDLKVIEGSQETLLSLSHHFELFIATAAMERPASFTAKYEWLQEHFSFIPDKNYVFCGDKSIIHADYLIDDSVRHFQHFAGTGILFSAPHNLHETGYVRVNNWQEVRDYFSNEVLE